MGHNNEDFNLFKREFLIGLYEPSSRKFQETRLDAYEHDTNRYVYEDTSSRTVVYAVKDQSNDRFR